ncbi:MAG: hypothetical protein QF718_02535 [Phycisphaerales bacterium]|jgi:hypothetical protein|nr:hypothetical protein [Phycisphaerales bacterium]
MQRLQLLIMSILCSTMITTFVTASASAPPMPSMRKSPAVWMGFGMMFVFFGAVVAVSLMSSKRDHQD